METLLQNKQEFSNVTGNKTVAKLTGCKKPSPLKSGALNLLTGGLATGALAKKYKAQLKSYNECITNYKNTIQAQANSSAVTPAIQQKLDDANKKIAETKNEISNIEEKEKEAPAPEEKKFLGMPKNIGIGVTVGVSLLLATVTGIILYKRLA